VGTITNLQGGKLRLERVKAETVVLHRTRPGWSYVHHASVAHFAGRFHAIWSNGRTHEDDVSQRVMRASSSDGLSWTRPRPLAGPVRGRRRELTLTAGGMHPVTGGRSGTKLVAYLGVWEWSESQKLLPDRRAAVGEHVGTTLWATWSRTGRRWSRPVDLGVRCVPNHGPQATSSGRLIIAGALMFPWTDDATGLGGWRTAGLYPDDLDFEYFDDSQGFPRAVRATEGRLPWLCEGSLFETGDGRLHMLLRSQTGFLWESVSRDDGLTWSQPSETRFTDECSKFHFGRLPDGRWYCVSNPDRDRQYHDGRRSPLVLAVSEDGVDFSTGYIVRGGEEDWPPQRISGVYKGLGFQYPHTMVHGRWLYVIYSVMKEDVAVSRVRLADI